MASSCKNEPKGNIFNEENFPALNRNENQEDVNEVGENEATDEMISKETEKVENMIAVNNTDQNINELAGATAIDEIDKTEKTAIDKTVIDKAESEIENSNGIKNSKKITENNITDSSDTPDILNVDITQDQCLVSCSETFKEQTDKEIKDIMTNRCNETLPNEKGKNNIENEANASILDDESNKNMHIDSMRKLNTHIEKNKNDISPVSKIPMLTQRSTRLWNYKQKDEKNIVSKDKKAEKLDESFSKTTTTY